MLFSAHLFLLLAVLPSTALNHSSHFKSVAALYDENIAARIWRTASRGAPDEGGVGWPSYTHSAYSNTRMLPTDPDHKPGTNVNTSASGWTAGFYPASLWQLLHRRKNLLPQSTHQHDREPSLDGWLAMAQAWTDPLITNQNLTTTHDIGFLAYPFEAALQFNDETTLQPVLAQMANNLASRHVPGAGVIGSRDNKNSTYSQNASHADSVLVIIDNMMGLPLLVRAVSTYSYNKTLLDIAIAHANQPLKHHIGPNGTTYHVCDYSATTGSV